MCDVGEQASADAVAASLDRLAAEEGTQSNCLFQLALMVARIAVEPGPEGYKEGAAQTLMGLVRAKPKGNVVRLFGGGPRAHAGPSGVRVAGGRPPAA